MITEIIALILATPGAVVAIITIVDRIRRR